MSRDLKVGIDGAVRMEGGRRFQSLGAATEKAREPALVWVTCFDKARDWNDLVKME